MPPFTFEQTLQKLRDTPKGKEATMYGPIRDLLIQVLGYPAADVDIDTAGEGGRPDVTARAPSGLLDAQGKTIKIDWIVVEAKDEHCFRHQTSREAVFKQKAKYIGTNTAWFVMVDPEVLIARRVTGQDFATTADIELELRRLTRPQCEQALALLHYEKAGVPEQLKQFRAGDESLIATERLDRPDPATSTPKQLNRALLARRRFYQTLREATTHLQEATRQTLARLAPTLQRYRDLAQAFGEEFHSYTFASHTLTIQGSPQGVEETRRHDKAATRLRKELAKAPHLARLALEGLPAFRTRTGVDETKLEELFSIETANLILARILLLRFFEDHKFFGPVKYVCNGGVDAFQKMRTYFKASYTRLLEEAYRSGSRLYAAAFDETELDWIFGTDDPVLSEAIEWTMFQFSRYDFTTVRGDVLSGIYDRFLNRAQRKRLGEFYTPPSVARYIVKRVGVSRNSRVLDPACGSGTFLIEAFLAMLGPDLDRGLADYTDVQDVFSRIAGNDLNTFSSVLTQIQLLWQVLGMKKEIAKHGFPDLLITGKVNSLVHPDQFALLDRFAEIDQPDYEAVIGNPPYVRQERSAQDLDPHTIALFEAGRDSFHGISAKRNAYTLFIYRALDSWCKPSVGHGAAGKLGFIVPVSLFDANEAADLRALFAVGQRWTLLEIIDLEIIYRKVFDADVLPAIIIAENRPATADDHVSIRLATKECVHLDEESALPTFDFESLPEQQIPYPQLFTPDGRIMTRLTPRRLEIIQTLWKNPTFGDAAMPYWVKKEGSKIVEWTNRRPNRMTDWTEQRMIAGGVAFRGERPSARRGHGFDVYKGENIIATELQGDPAATGLDLTRISDSSLWRYQNILPSIGFAIARVAHCPNAIRFDPTQLAFTNTATLFFPRTDYSRVPVDLLFLSHVYVFFYALAARMGILRTLRSDIYPTNLAILPWSEQFVALTPKLEALRGPLVEACRHWMRATEAMQEALAGLNLKSLKHHVRADPAATISWGSSFEVPDYQGEIATPRRSTDGEVTRVWLSTDLLDSIEINRADLAAGLVDALLIHEGDEIGRAELLNLPIPVSTQERTQWTQILNQYQPSALRQVLDTQLQTLDHLVGEALGLSADDVRTIYSECTEDPFLRNIRPRYPGTQTRKQGFRTGLDATTRYQ